MWQHLKIGAKASESLTLSLHFCWDAESGRVVIGQARQAISTTPVTIQTENMRSYDNARTLVAATNKQIRKSIVDPFSLFFFTYVLAFNRRVSLGIMTSP